MQHILTQLLAPGTGTISSMCSWKNCRSASVTYLEGSGVLHELSCLAAGCGCEWPPLTPHVSCKAEPLTFELFLSA